MRIIEQIQTAVLGLTDQFVIDGSTGTRAIKFEDLLKAINEKISWMALWGDNIPVEARRNIWRGKNLGSQVTQTQWNEIGAGTFRGLFIGDYWEINDTKYRIVDMDYWLGSGDTKCNTHHLVIMPDLGMIEAKMNDIDSASGGYANSKMRTVYLNNVKSVLINDFGVSHILSHRECLINSVQNGIPVGGPWYDSVVELPNEKMMYGNTCFSVVNGEDSEVPYQYSIDNIQLSGMALNPMLINIGRQKTWLRDIVSNSHFSMIYESRMCGYGGAAYSFWVRPVFGIKAEDAA